MPKPMQESGDQVSADHAAPGEPTGDVSAANESAANESAHGRAADHVGLDAGLIQRIDDADMGPSAGGVAAEREADAGTGHGDPVWQVGKGRALSDRNLIATVRHAPPRGQNKDRTTSLTFFSTPL
jgi:hypothetical protein